MKKSDLKTGMVVKLNNGEVGTIVLGSEAGDVICFDNKMISLNAFDEGLEYMYTMVYPKLYIVEVRTCSSFIENVYNMPWSFNYNGLPIVYARKEDTKNIKLSDALQQLEELHGCKVNVTF